MVSDSQVRWAARLLTLGALVAFVAFLVLLDPIVFVLSLLLAAAAYAFFHEDLRRNPVEMPAPVSFGREDASGEGSPPTVSPGVSMGGVHLSFETRSRWAKRR